MRTTENEITRRRTFAIISHPDAGKTTLTEKLLLYGGAIQSAGSVKGKRSNKHAISDWMEIEKQRGISVTSSVLQFDYQDYCINILDTPGHQDFSEDTYRTLMAADSAVMVIDASKGVESQTKKLFKVCLMRKIPVFTFINKMDRAARDPFELMEHIEKELGLATYPMNWPIGNGKDFKGVFNRKTQEVVAFHGGNHGQNAVKEIRGVLDDQSIKDYLGPHFYDQILEDSELINGATYDWNDQQVANGQLTPVFFGSALTNFGVQMFLDSFLNLSSSPLPRVTSDDFAVDPLSANFSGFVFKIQANMNKAHRDRIAFIRICSGKFEKGMDVIQTRTNKHLKLAQPQQFMAQERAMVEKAYAGDVIGVFDPGIFTIGDSLYEGKKSIKFPEIPTFAPEHFARVTQKDTMKRKQFTKGINQIAQEGAIQVFFEINIGMEEIIVGGVGVLQFEVLEQRLSSEYNVEIKLEILPYQMVRWISCQNIDPNSLNLTQDTKRVRDFHNRNSLIFMNNWGMKWAIEQNKDLLLAEVGNNI